jgi:hypothetical protein
MTDPVQHQLEAFNSRNLDVFMEAYALDTRIEDGARTELMSGAEQLRAFYGSVFDKQPGPPLRARQSHLG